MQQQIQQIQIRQLQIRQLQKAVNRLISQKQEILRGSKLPRVKTAFKYFQELKKDVQTFLALPHPEERQLDELKEKLDTYRHKIIELLPWGWSYIPALNDSVQEMDQFLFYIKFWVSWSYSNKDYLRSRAPTQSPTQRAGSRDSDESFFSARQHSDTVSPHDQQSDTVSPHDQQSDTVSQHDQQSDTDSSFHSANYGQIPPVSDSPRRSPHSSTSPSSSTGGTSQIKTTSRRSSRSSTSPSPSTEGRRRPLKRIETNFPKRNHALKHQVPLTAVGLMTIVAFAVSLGFALSKTK